MMRDAYTHHNEDPAHRWAVQLSGLMGRRRDTVIRALRNSVDSGFPANADGVRTLVAYAEGQISARQYVAQILESLGFMPAAYVPPPAPAPQPLHNARVAEPWRAPARTEDPWHDVLSASYTPPGAARTERHEGTTMTQPGQTSRQQAVRDYVNGLIPVEEFLRLTHGGTT
ncbi:MAG: hypothetical protein ABIN55_08225 [Aeromicrobium sp.]